MSDGKQRHGVLTAFLVLAIIVNSFLALMYLLERQNYPLIPNWAFSVLVIIALVNVVCAIALLRWKKWGFFCLVGTTVVAFFINLMIGRGLLHGLLSFMGIAILYWALQIGKERKGWTQLD